LNNNMATSNFKYVNRCIVVTEDDFVLGLTPVMGESVTPYNRNYPSTYLAISDDFTFWNIFITSGYYQDACIDYDESDIDVEYYLGGTQYYTTQKAFFNECKLQFNITEYRLRKICGKVGVMDIEDYLENAYEYLTDYLRECERIKVDKCLNQLKQAYGYEEVICMGRASNGESFYEKVS
ncbi:MAG: hypothetical protein K2H20_00940, partial [Bacilli bacterium]|nr:hypothetical protein [Bacilli bacterium]